MKDRKTKEKKHESTIGKIIYGFLLFMPLMAIAVTSLISTFNMSAKEETEIIYKYQSNEVNDESDLIVGNIYHYRIDLTTVNGHDFARVGDIYNIVGKRDSSFTINHPGNYFTLYSGNTRVEVLRYDPWTQIGYINVDNSIFECDLIFYGIYGNDNFVNYSYTEFNVIDYVETHNVEPQEVFYRAINKVQQSPLFNWAENSIIYTGMSNFTTSLSITTPFIPLLLTYWLIISVVYFLYDIILIILVVLHKKIHYLEESI